MKGIFLTIVVIVIFSCTGTQNSGHQASDKNETENTTLSHTSENSLDWEGTYCGILPCENCEGLETTVTLNKDLTYKQKRHSIGKTEEPTESRGKFAWNKNGSSITLTPTDTNGSVQYFVGENTLTQLDAQGNKVGGSDAGKHILTKANFDILEKYWKLVEVNGKAVAADSTFIKEPHFILKEADSRVTGNGGCNTIAGTHRIAGQNHINLSKLITTKMFCPGMNIETEFLNMLQTADNFDLAGDTLILRNQSKEKIATLYAVYMK